MNAKLHRATTTRLALPEALKVLGDRPAVGLFYAPGWCGFGLVDERGNVSGSEAEKPLPLRTIYEARVFRADAELRWWNDPVGGEHRAALLSEDGLTPPGWEPDGKPLAVLETICRRYLLWGQRAEPRTDLRAGWTRLTTARIGALDVPRTGGDHFRILAREYLATFADGNVAVAEERLLEIEPYTYNPAEEDS